MTETLAAPVDNPHRAWMRIGGFDFFAGGKRAAACTWQGDVWIIEGVDGASGDEIRWRRFATGLYQPLGLKIRDGEIFVLGRDQITRLHDTNGDGEADFYENYRDVGSFPGVTLKSPGKAIGAFGTKSFFSIVKPLL